MTSLLAIYGEGVARGVNVVCCLVCLGAVIAAIIEHCSDDEEACCKCLWTALVFAVVLLLFPGPDFFQALGGRP